MFDVHGHDDEVGRDFVLILASSVIEQIQVYFIIIKKKDEIYKMQKSSLV
jgi:hypothetical protein